MKCAKLHLHERSKPRARVANSTDRPRRFCQKRMVNPAHEEDLRWTDLFDRFYCNPTVDAAERTVGNGQAPPEDLFLSVQNIKFDGDVNEIKRPKTCFKYKAIRDGQKHRMFVKQVVEEKEDTEDCSSQLTCYYFDDYVKYISNPDQNASLSGKSSILLCSHNNIVNENKAVQEISKRGSDLKKNRTINRNFQNHYNVKAATTVKAEPPDLSSQDTKVAYHKAGKRKCLTISRNQSPETVQVIRVDVVCHGRARAAPGAGDATPNEGSKQANLDNLGALNSKLNTMKNNHFSDRYLLTSSTKTLDEHVSGGAKVTLLCKTFRLSSRTKSNNEKNIKNNNQK